MRTEPEVNVAEHLARASTFVDQALERWMPAETVKPGEVHRAMRYSVFSGGKRLRPALALTVGDALGIPREAVLPSACALELIHAFSLIHDDLPAMDDDDLRRGRPTNHKVFGEAVAILAGDALSTLAFEIVAEHTPDKGVVPDLVLELARATGTQGMIGGQILDLLAEGQTPDEKLVADIHLMKTAALLRASCTMPAIAGRAGAPTIAALRKFGDLLGHAFQIVDDILDETSSPEQLGKGTNKDRERGKMTYPAAVGLDRSKVIARNLIDEATRAVEALDRSGQLRALARFVADRSF